MSDGAPVVRFTETTLPGVWLVDLEPHRDHRGAFARTFCRRAFEARGLQGRIEQCSISCNRRAGTLRGMHVQIPPAPEARLVRCVRGALHDVVLDLRPASPTFGGWAGWTLTGESGRAVYVPEGCGHGFLTLEDETVVHYQMSQAYRRELARGVRWNDPAFAIRWPEEPVVISDRDRSFPDFDPRALYRRQSAAPP